MPAKSPDPKTVVLLFSWQATWPGLLAAALGLVAIAWYVRALSRLPSAGRDWSPATTVSFVVGVVVSAYAFGGGIARYQADNFTTDVVQLLLLAYVAPPFLAAGCPLRLALLTSRGRAGGALVRALRGGWARVLSHPLAGFVAVVASLYVYFHTGLFPLSERHPAFLAYVHIHFLVVGGLMWWPLVGRDALGWRRFGWRFALVLASIPLFGYLGLEVAAIKSPLYPAGNTLADTHQGGNVLWLLASLFAVVALAYLFVEWAREEERRAVQADRQLDAALAAARSVSSAGEGMPDELPG